jgi:hypothetical protein
VAVSQAGKYFIDAANLEDPEKQGASSRETTSTTSVVGRQVNREICVHRITPGFATGCFSGNGN